MTIMVLVPQHNLCVRPRPREEVESQIDCETLREISVHATSVGNKAEQWSMSRIRHINIPGQGCVPFQNSHQQSRLYRHDAY